MRYLKSIVLLAGCLVTVAYAKSWPPGSTITFGGDGGNSEILTVVKPIGSGAFGSVYEAKTANGQSIAVKVFNAGRSRDDILSELDQFLRDQRYRSAQHLLTYEPPQTGTVTDGNVSETVTFLRSPLVNPVGLLRAEFGDRFEDLPGSAQRERIELISRIAEQGLATLEELAQLGYAHRDIKPDNMALTGSVQEFLAGSARLVFMDLDLVRRLDRPPPDGITGSFAYMSPELVSQTIPTLALSDAYALGATLFNLLTGEDLIANSRAQTSGGTQIQSITDMINLLNDPRKMQTLYERAQNRLRLVLSQISNTNPVELGAYRSAEQVVKLVTALIHPDPLRRLALLEGAPSPGANAYAEKVRGLEFFHNAPLKPCQVLGRRMSLESTVIQARRAARR